MFGFDVVPPLHVYLYAFIIGFILLRLHFAWGVFLFAKSFLRPGMIFKSFEVILILSLCLCIDQIRYFTVATDESETRS